MNQAANPVRVAYMITPFSDAGADRQLMELLKRLDRRRFEPTLYLSEAQGFILEELHRLGIRVVDVGRWGRNELATLRLIPELRKTRPQIIHSWMFVANTWARIAGRAAGVPAIITSDRSMETDLSALYRRIDAALSPLSDRVIVNARAIADNVHQHRGVPQSKIVTIYNGVDLERYGASIDPGIARSRIGLPANRPIVGMIGSFSPRKRWDVFLDAAAQIARTRDAAFVCVGRGALLETMMDRAAKLGLEGRVFFLGARSDMPDILSALDIVAHSSDDEGTPNVIMEAMCASRPVVATNAGGTAELMEDGETGFVVPRGRPEVLAARVEQVLNDPQLAFHLGRAGRRRIEEHFSFDTCVGRTMDLYDEVLRDGRAAGRIVAA